MAHRRGLLFMLFLVLYFVAYQILFTVLFTPGGVLDFVGEVLFASLWFQMFFQLTVLLLPLAIWLMVSREKVNKYLPHMSLGKTNILYIIGLSIFFQPAINAISGLTTLIFPNEVGEFMLGSIDYPWFVLILIMAVTPAICEEVVFRGYIQSTFKDKPFWAMALINGLFFAIIHFNAHQFFFAFVAGIFWAYMVYATRSIRAAVISHFIMNASQVSLVWVSVRMMGWLERLGEGLEGFIEQYGEGIYLLGTDFDAAFEAVSEMDLADPQMRTALTIFIVIFSIVVIFSSIITFFLLRGFSKHNKKRMAEYDAKIAAETEEPAELLEPEIPPGEKRKNLIIDGVIILAIVAVYVLLVFDIPFI